MLSAGAGARRRAEMDSTSVAAVAAVHRLLFAMQWPVARRECGFPCCHSWTPTLVGYTSARSSNCWISLRHGLQANEGVVQRGQDHFAISHLQQSHASGYACNRRAPTAASLGNKGEIVVVASASASLGFHPRGAALGAAQQVGGDSPCRRCRRVGVATRAFIERCSEKARPRCGASSCSPR